MVDYIRHFWMPSPQKAAASRHPFEAKNQAALLIKILRGQLLGVKSVG